MGSGPSQYDAFISYSHAHDRALADALQRELQRFGVPWYRIRTQPSATSRTARSLSPLRIFRDDTDLAAAPGLWPQIRQALSSARWFILVASPTAAESPWVRQELSWWLENRSVERILVAWTDGELAWKEGDFDWERTTALPRLLSGRFPDEPIWIDLRRLRLAGAQPTLGDLAADFAAPIHAVEKDSLVGAHVRHARRARRTVRSVIATLTALVVGLTGTTSFALQQRAAAIDQRDAAIANQAVAEAATIADTQPGLARQLVAAAYHLKPTPEVQAALDGSGAIPGEIHVDGDALAYSADGGVIAIARSARAADSDSGQPAVKAAIWLYDAATLALESSEELGNLPIGALAFSPSVSILATGYGHDVVLWSVTNPRTPARLGILQGHRDNVRAVAFSSDGRTIATASRDGAMGLWNVAVPSAPILLSATALTGGPTASVSMQFQPGGHSLGVVTVPLADLPASIPPAAADRISVLTEKPAPRLWNVADPRRPTPLPVSMAPVDSIAYSVDGSRLVTDSQTDLRLWDMDADGRPGASTQLATPDAGIATSLAVYGAGDQVAAAGADGYVRLWDVSQPKQAALIAALAVPSWDARNIMSLTFSPDGRHLAMLSPGSNAGPGGAGVRAGTVRVWNVADGRETRAIAALRGHAGQVHHLVVDQAHRLLATAAGTVVRLWDISDPREPAPLSALDIGHVIDAVSLSPNAGAMAVATGDTIHVASLVDRRKPGSVGQWHVRDTRGACASVARYGALCSMQATTLAFRDERFLAVGDTDAQVSLFDTGRPEVDAPAGVVLTRGSVTALSFLRQHGRPTLVAAGFFSFIDVWDMTDVAHGQRLSAVDERSYELEDLVLGAGDRFLVTAGRDGTVHLWEVGDDGRRLTPGRIIHDTGDVDALALSPPGPDRRQRLATLGRDRTIRLYDVVDARTEPVLRAIIHIGNVASTFLAFVGDARTLAIGTEHGAVDIWNLNPDYALRRICAGVGQRITRAEWARDLPGVDYRPPC